MYVLFDSEGKYKASSIDEQMTTNQWIFVENFTNPDIQDITRDPSTLVITITNRDYDFERTEK